MLPQDFGHWPVTARENIALGQRAQDPADIEAAVLAAVPGRLYTNLAPSWWGGRELSGGQWQKLAAARAFTANPF
ncbi:ABC transporter ATP-binding protein/permease [Streptomyces clavuligerus]|uniref:ABC transporter ATP-binding protein/permease n=1 Tax=Streptomyces clavuligerus TaxID=1901 RepID=UPI00020D93A8|nr:ABC transporter ATP-binding protein/permease [Streptomyces clavuligerus]WDN56050.1 ABC transporter ATP-binding protein/permease [Streptomyces clavuligerus]